MGEGGEGERRKRRGGRGERGREKGEKREGKGLVWFDFCFTALQHILGHFGHGQLPLPHCSWASPLGSLPVLSAHSLASN